MTTRRTRRTRRLVLTVAVVAALVASACSGGDDTESSNIVPVNGAVPATAAATPAAPAAATGAAPTAAPVENSDEFGQIVAVYDSFLALRARAITDGLPLVELEPVATPGAIEQVLQLRAENDALEAEESYGVLDDLVEWSNVTGIGRTDAGMVFTDCTERHYVTPGGFTVIRFVQNAVTVVEDDGSYKVDRVEVTQNGAVALTPDEFGCAPQSFRDRAEATARQAVQTAAALVADPVAALDGELPPIFADEARTELQLALETLADQGYRRISDELVTYTVLGMDVHRPEFTVVVSVCRTFPNGRSYIDATGEPTVPDLPSGAETTEWIYVNLEAVAADAASDTAAGNTAGDTAADSAGDIVIAVEDRGLGCDRS